MNRNTVSAECFAGMCSQCRYEDCACRHHLIEQEEYDGALDGEER
jgi:hypothetical protein